MKEEIEYLFNERVAICQNEGGQSLYHAKIIAKEQVLKEAVENLGISRGEALKVVLDVYHEV